MSIIKNFERNILALLLKDKAYSWVFKEVVSDQFFKEDSLILIFDLLSGYVEKYKESPSKENLLFFLSEVLKKEKADTKKILTQTIERELNVIYNISYKDTGITTEYIIKEIQKTKILQFLKDNAEKLYDPDQEFVEKFHKNLGSIYRLKDNKMGHQDGMWLFKENTYTDAQNDNPIIPTYLKGLNKFTSKMGFKSPENILLAAGPKCFKTGFFINLAKNFAIDGYDVLYLDFENGIDEIRDRTLQSINKMDKLKLLESKIKKDDLLDIPHKGDVRYKQMRPYKSNLLDVRIELDYLVQEYDFKPKIIIYDYLDLAGPLNPRETNDLKILQENYMDAVSLNMKYNTVSFSPTQLNRNFEPGEIPKLSDLAKYYGKAFDVHALFCLVRNEMEIERGFARLYPWIQRSGVQMSPDNYTVLRIDESLNTIEEVPMNLIGNR